MFYDFRLIVHSEVSSIMVSKFWISPAAWPLLHVYLNQKYHIGETWQWEKLFFVTFKRFYSYSLYGVSFRYEIRRSIFNNPCLGEKRCDLPIIFKSFSISLSTTHEAVLPKNWTLHISWNMDAGLSTFRLVLSIWSRI